MVMMLVYWGVGGRKRKVKYIMLSEIIAAEGQLLYTKWMTLLDLLKNM
jgi:hypothetical protein